MSVATASLMCRVAPREQLLLDFVESAARVTNRPARPLHLQALLQLPRWADSNGFVSVAIVESLLSALAEELPDKVQWLVQSGAASPRSLRFHKVERDKAREIMQEFHYIRSPRTDGRAYGLSTSAGNLVALCVSSPLDVAGPRALLAAHGRPTDFARVVSRVFAFEGAPKNSISYMLARSSREERDLGATDLITYVNPNMGFTGTSYLASNWQLLGSEPDTKYRYVDGRYITDRELAARFGQHDDGTYCQLLAARFSVSAMPLEPLLVFYTSLSK